MTDGAIFPQWWGRKKHLVGQMPHQYIRLNWPYNTMLRIPLAYLVEPIPSGRLYSDSLLENSV